MTLGTSPAPHCLCGHPAVDHTVLPMGYRGRCHDCDCPRLELDGDR